LSFLHSFDPSEDTAISVYTLSTQMYASYPGDTIEEPEVRIGILRLFPSLFISTNF